MVSLNISVVEGLLASIFGIAVISLCAQSDPVVSMYLELLLLLVPCVWPIPWFTRAPLLVGAQRKITNVQVVKRLDDDLKQEEPLSPEEEEAVAAAKRIVAKARAQFLSQNNGFVPMASAPAQKLAQDAAALFEKNLGATLSAENKPWVSNYKNEKKEIEIFSAEFPGHSCKRWKVVATLQSDLETAYDAMFVPESRRTWDALVKDLRIVQINDCPLEVGDGLAITSVVTNPVMVVSSRSMLDIALQKCLKRGGITLINVSVPSDFEEMKLDPLVDGAVRATTHIGSGALIEPIKGRPGYLKYVLVSTIELGGWLPPSVINATMTTSIAQSTEQMQEFLIGKMKHRNNDSKGSI